MGLCPYTAFSKDREALVRDSWNVMEEDVAASGLKLFFKVNAESSCCGGLEIDADEILDVGDRDLPVDLFLTRTLPPALTLKEGYAKIKNAIGELKANPRSAISGVLRYQAVMLQVLVPPSTKASNWLYHQHRDLSGYPQFYISTAQTHDPSLEVASRNRLLEVSGVGTAVCLRGFSCIQKGYSLLARSS